MKNGKATPRWKLTLVSMNGQTKFLMLPVEGNGQVKVAASLLKELFPAPLSKYRDISR